MTRAFDQASHTYRLNGRRIPSVTQITGTIAPFVGVPREILEAKADLGTAVHYATQLHDEDDLEIDSLPDIVRPYLQAYIRFGEETGWRPQTIEQQVWAEAYGYAGTLDRTGHFTRLKGIKSRALCLLDLKATYRLAPVYGVQTALYANALPEKPKHRFALQLKPDGSYNLTEHRDPSDLSVGLAALTILNWQTRHGHNKDANP